MSKSVQDFIDAIENVKTQYTGPNAMWAFAAERLSRSLANRLPESELKNSIYWQLEGTLYNIVAKEYLLYQNYGVKGSKSGTANRDEIRGRTHAYGTKIPPADVFERYTSDKSHQFGIATNIFKFGIKPKSWFTLQGLKDEFIQYCKEYIQNN